MSARARGIHSLCQCIAYTSADCRQVTAIEAALLAAEKRGAREALESLLEKKSIWIDFKHGGPLERMVHGSSFAVALAALDAQPPQPTQPKEEKP
jgi:hypothetical protein